MAVTNRGKKLILEYCFGKTAQPANFYVALLTSASAPTVDSNLLSDHTEIDGVNGYTTGGYSLSLNATDFDNSNENDTANSAYIQIKDVVWTASGGSIGAARYAVLLNANATPGNREIIAYWDLVSDRTVSTGQTLTLQNLEIDMTEPA